MDHSTDTAHPPVSKSGAFFKGMRTGAFNSGLLFGIFSLSTLAFNTIATAVGWGTLGFIGLPAMGVTLLATSLFSGVMAAKREAAHASQAKHEAANVAPSVARSKGKAPQIEMDASDMPERTSNWAERTGRNEGSQSRVQEILANGAMSDKDRATAILAAREQASQQQAER